MSTSSPLPFRDSSPLTLGVELELQLLSHRDYDLTRAATDLLAGLDGHNHPCGEIKLEITESMIEISTQARDGVDGIACDLAGLRDTLRQRCRQNNIALAGGGTHPFHHWPERRICPGERFDGLYHRYGYLAKQFTVFGQHIHVGCANADDALWLTQALGVYVPVFIAFSASSPFVEGVDTFFQSARLNAVSAFPLSGQCPPLADWAAFSEHFAFLRDCGIVQSIKDLYWDVRPKPEFGTVEIRVCDTPLSIGKACALTALAQCLAHRLLIERPRFDWVQQAHVARFNKFQACRFGFAGQLSLPAERRPIRLRDQAAALLEQLHDDARALGCSHWLAQLDYELQAGRSDADWLRNLQATQGNLHDVARIASEHFFEHDCSTTQAAQP